MPGFFGLIAPNIGKSKEFSFDLTECCETVRETAYFENAFFTKSHFHRYGADQCFEMAGRDFVCYHGTWLNRKELMNRYHCETNAGLLEHLYNSFPKDFIKQLRGDFAGFLYNHEEKKLFLYSGFFNEKPVFYLQDKARNSLIVCTSFFDAVQGARKAAISLTLSALGCYYLLTFGHMLGDETLFNEIRKLPPASILTFQENVLSIDQYYTLNELEFIDENKKDLIENLDERFTRAIKMEYDKDLELGLPHLATLSGGLDSRMNVLYASKLGYERIHAFTFSRSGYLDEKISKKISAENRFQLSLINLDPGDYLKEFYKPTVANGGLVAYYGGAASLYALEQLDHARFGLVHTGQLGDAILGTYLDGPSDKPPDMNNIFGLTISRDLINRIPVEKLNSVLRNYKSSDIFKFYERGVNFIFNGNVMLNRFSEEASPFLYLDFVEYALKIHPKYRYRELIYIDWMNRKLQEATRYTWEKFKLKPVNTLFNPVTYFIPKSIKAFYVLLYRYGILPRYHMNPFEYWAQTNESLTKTLDQYITDHLYLLEQLPEIRQDVVDMARRNNKFAVKGLIVTLLVSLESYSASYK